MRISQGVLRSTLANLLGEIGIRPDDNSLTIINAVVETPVITGMSLIDLESFGGLVAEKLSSILKRPVKPGSVTFSRSRDNQLWITVALT